VVVVGTGNHWVLDVVAGWAVVVLGYAVADRWPARDRAVNTPPRAAATHHGSGPASLSGA
jgi:membrane-associated phospholipid phosphatase